jgi:hypothetical protein
MCLLPCFLPGVSLTSTGILCCQESALTGPISYLRVCSLSPSSLPVDHACSHPEMNPALQVEPLAPRVPRGAMCQPNLTMKWTKCCWTCALTAPGSQVSAETRGGSPGVPGDKMFFEGPNQNSQPPTSTSGLAQADNLTPLSNLDVPAIPPASLGVVVGDLASKGLCSHKHCTKVLPKPVLIQLAPRAF